MATHPLTMISRVELLQLIHIDWLHELISVEVYQLGGFISVQILNNIQPVPGRSKLASRVADQSPEDFQD